MTARLDGVWLTDAFNLAAAAGADDTGARVLEPGATLSGMVCFRLESA